MTGRHTKASDMPDELRGRVIVLLDGQDVTDRCFEAWEGGNGEVGLFKVNENGRKYLEPALPEDLARDALIGSLTSGAPLPVRKVAAEHRQGRVAIALKPEVDDLPAPEANRVYELFKAWGR